MMFFAKLLYWKLCFPEFVDIVPIRLRVVSGPFRGMPYTSLACGSAHSAKVLGTYEKELHTIIGELNSQQFVSVIDIGAAEGYYAIGLARANPDCTVIAFEAEELGRSLLRKMAESNGVANLSIRGQCSVPDLAPLVASKGIKLIICDIEGSEAELLDPESLPGLRDCSILVELHDSPEVSVSEILRRRFQPSHEIQEVISSDRTSKDFPSKNMFSKLLPQSVALRAMDEFRGVQRWFWMWPLDRVS
jgi:hypothetical protein